MTPRMTNPALLLPEALEAVLALAAATAKSDLPQRTVELVQLRASQINGTTCGTRPPATTTTWRWRRCWSASA
jgi:hypothetical protein